MKVAWWKPKRFTDQAANKCFQRAGKRHRTKSRIVLARECRATLGLSHSKIGCDYFKSTKIPIWQIPTIVSPWRQSKTSPARMLTASSVRSQRSWPVSHPTSMPSTAARFLAFPTPSVALLRKWPFPLLRSLLLTLSPT